jgi:hypothetical protein
MRQRLHYLVQLERLHQIFRTPAAHGGDDLVRMGVARGSKQVHATAAAVVKPLANPTALLTLIEINDANSVLKLLQRPCHLTGSYMLVDIVDDMGSRRLDY